ncbi:hypothetical protein FA95DRAFT_128859 [Auriscalpium vulgare]|uniref:Uncharacterized protein n=1 Tax=Auriscalpium vulgare TaxID=40419 RepID=A0ACB8RPA6_9AGAM|nr:hypothetical protein FA95DRAFT_128859 [Auriscalpium vulgare]
MAPQRVAVTELLDGGRHKIAVGAGVAPLWVRERAQADPAPQSRKYGRVYVVGRGAERVDVPLRRIAVRSFLRPLYVLRREDMTRCTLHGVRGH